VCNKREFERVGQLTLGGAWVQSTTQCFVLDARFRSFHASIVVDAVSQQQERGDCSAN
jgi:hypothetical protein